VTTFGIDTISFTFKGSPTAPVPPRRLDQLPSLRTGGAFLAWNGNARALFAGRNFLLGDDGFIWGHAEATNASVAEQDGVLDNNGPGPANPGLLTLTVDQVAPIQAPHGARQGLTDDRGLLCGAIDANAICARISAAITAGEFLPSAGHLMHVWLSVDPSHPFSAEYWAGWADRVNNTVLQNSSGIQSQPFRAAIICSYVSGPDGKFRPDPQVTSALATRRRGLDTSIHGLWADSKLWDNAPADLAANGSPLLDWTRFDQPTAPVLWRFAGGYTLADGTAAPDPFSIDAANPEATPVDFMLSTQTWQPNVADLETGGNFGVSNNAAITATDIANIQANFIPEMNDSGCPTVTGDPPPGRFKLPGGAVKVIGRYIRYNKAISIGQQEAKDLSDAGFRLFTIWEETGSTRNVPGLGTVYPAVQNKPVNDWGPFAATAYKYIWYFQTDPDQNPATGDTGDLDGADAFQYCWTQLHQPSQTPVFFAIDFSPYDMPDPHAVPFPPPPPPPPAPPNPTQGWPANPAPAVFEPWIKAYFTKIRAARDALFAQGGPYYLIGAYADGKTLELLYKQGVVSHFWQPASASRPGGHPPLWPWYHVNRWQFNVEKNLAAAGWTVPGTKVEVVDGADPDVDWGDGGTWNLNDDLARGESGGLITRFIDWGELVVPTLPAPPQ